MTAPTQRYPEPPADEWWGPEQVQAFLCNEAVRSAAARGTIAFLEISPAFASDASAECQDQAVSIAGAAALELVHEAERMAQMLELDPEARRLLIADRIAAYRGRLIDMAARAVPGGHA